MNAQSTVQHLLDADWHTVISEELAANPAGIAFSVEPGIMGQYDAQLGLPCDPYERGYRKATDCESYIVAYHDCTQLWSEMVQAKNDELDADRSWLDGELQMLVDAMEDENYWRNGAW